MFSSERQHALTIRDVRPRVLAVLLVLCLSFLATGCVDSATPKHVTALAEATAPVVDQATEAYHTVQAVHAQSVDYDAAASFDKTSVFVPSSIQDWPPEKEIQIRLAVLAALQLYVKELQAIVGGMDAPALDAASKSMGNNMTTLANTLAPAAESALGVTPPAPASTTTTTVTTTTGSTTTTTSSTASTTPPLISAGIEKGLAVGIDALGKFLVERTVDKELPAKVEAMDTQVAALCETMAKEIDLLQMQEKIDSDNVIDKQTAFARNDKLDPEERRTEFMKLPAMAREQRQNSDKLTSLRAALLKLELTHHAFAAAEQGNNPETLTQRLGDLGAAGESLGKFYTSLSSGQ